jgi:hypothetical protein
MHRGRHIAQRALDDQSIRLKLLQTFSACDEQDLSARHAQSRADVASNGAGAQYQNAHGFRSQISDYRTTNEWTACKVSQSAFSNAAATDPTARP